MYSRVSTAFLVKLPCDFLISLYFFDTLFDMLQVNYDIYFLLKLFLYFFLSSDKLLYQFFTYTVFSFSLLYLNCYICFFLCSIYSLYYFDSHMLLFYDALYHYRNKF